MTDHPTTDEAVVQAQLERALIDAETRLAALADQGDGDVAAVLRALQAAVRALGADAEGAQGAHARALEVAHTPLVAAAVRVRGLWLDPQRGSADDARAGLLVLLHGGRAALAFQWTDEAVRLLRRHDRLADALALGDALLAADPTPSPARLVLRATLAETLAVYQPERAEREIQAVVSDAVARGHWQVLHQLALGRAGLAAAGDRPERALQQARAARELALRHGDAQRTLAALVVELPLVERVQDRAATYELLVRGIASLTSLGGPQAGHARQLLADLRARWGDEATDQIARAWIERGTAPAA